MQTHGHCAACVHSMHIMLSASPARTAGHPPGSSGPPAVRRLPTGPGRGPWVRTSAGPPRPQPALRSWASCRGCGAGERGARRWGEREVVWATSCSTRCNKQPVRAHTLLHSEPQSTYAGEHKSHAGAMQTSRLCSGIGRTWTAGPAGPQPPPLWRARRRRRGRPRAARPPPDRPAAQPAGNQVHQCMLLMRAASPAGFAAKQEQSSTYISWARRAVRPD